MAITPAEGPPPARVVVTDVREQEIARGFYYNWYQDFVDNLFFKSTYYDLSGVGRLKINQRLSISSAVNLNILRKEKVPVSIYLVNGIKLQGQVDSFDQFVVLLKNSVNQMVYKHAISTVVLRSARDNDRESRRSD